MNLAKDDIKQIASFGLAGAVVASAYSMFKTYAIRKVGEPLEIETCSIHEDGQLLALLRKMETLYSHHDKVAYFRVVDTADQLLFLRLRLNKKEIEPDRSDRDHSYILFKRIQTNLKRLIDSMNKVHPKDVVMAQNLASKIAEKCEEHVTVIMRLCHRA